MLLKGELTKPLAWVKKMGLGSFPPSYATALGALYEMDAIAFMKAIPEESLDAVITSPPFALTKKKEYGNEPVERYLDWFLPFCLEIKRILKPTGSFVLDMGGAWLPGHPVRSMYHFEVAVRLGREFKLAQEFYWYNPARLPVPSEWIAVRRVRVKDAVNMIWWFGKTENPKADNKKVLQPYSESMKTLLRDGYRAKKRPSGHDISEKFNRDNGGAIPPNLITMGNTESNTHYLQACRTHKVKPHPARYPTALVIFFLNFLTDPGDLVYDPFAGSNSTGSACEETDRRWLATEIVAEYVKGSTFRFEEEVPPPPKKSKRGPTTQGRNGQADSHTPS
jgi:site-specific DNA-methyltransferase (cytosine-N4-specific)